MSEETATQTPDESVAPDESTYVLLLHGPEAVWLTATPADYERAMADHGAFTAACAEHGHRILGGEELMPSTESRVIRRAEGAVAVSDGPFTELVEQLGGFYLIATRDLDDLATLVARLLQDGEAAELRPVVAH